MLDKKALRQFAGDNPAPAIPVNHGLLHAQQVNYVIRSDIRIIARRRTLVLYVCDREKAAAGDSSPVWTMFQAGDDYITLARKEDGSATWREAAFKNLDKDYYFISKCAFYSARDEQRVCDFFRDHGHGGIAALVLAQKAILDRRAQERQRRREKKTVRRMQPLRALPRGLEGWIRREVMPAYFRCEHTSARKPITGTCTSCGKDATLPRTAHNDKIICPHCKRELTVKSAAKAGNLYDRGTVQVIEKISKDEVVIRIVKVYYRYSRDQMLPAERVYENARIFVRRGPDGKVITEPYYYSRGKGKLTHWMPGERPGFFGHYQYSFEADACGHVYCRNLPGALAGTPWEYCPLAAFYGHFHERMELTPFLRAYLEHPRLEHFIKTGFFNLASDLAYGGDPNRVLDESQGRTHRILKVDAGDVPFLRELDPGMGVLKIFQGYADLKDRQRLLRWRLDNQITHDVDHILERMTPHKFMRYMDGQFAAPDPDGGTRYGDMQHAVSEYRDYLDMCTKLGYDLSNRFVLYPKDLRQAHDGAQGRLKAEADEKMRREFQSAMEAAGRLEFETDGMKVVLPVTPDDVVAEGQALHHCVGSYIGRVARRECVILFVRRREDLEKPFYTVEIRGSKVVQVRGRDNHDPTPEVRKFMEQWERQVLRAA